jgi:glycosyltransferase involved in cell wall biosynthesis
MSLPLVSVIIPCYRQGHFLAGAIEAALGQTYPSVEVIVVNDGSDDQTDCVARRFGTRIKYVAQQNRGLAGARNAGIAVATGQYLHFLDADDRLDRRAIGWLVSAAGGREDVLCVMGIRTFEHDGGPYVDRPIPVDRTLELRLLTDNPAPPLSYLSPRSLVVASGQFDHRVRSCEDWDLWSKQIFAGSRLVLVPECGALYRVHAESMSKNLGLMARMRAAVMHRNLRRATENPARIRELGGDPAVLRRRLRTLRTHEYLRAGYWLREQGLHGQAAVQFGCCLARGDSRWSALTGLAKLVPHRLVRGMPRLSPRPA